MQEFQAVKRLATLKAPFGVPNATSFMGKVCMSRLAVTDPLRLRVHYETFTQSILRFYSYSRYKQYTKTQNYNTI